MDALYRCVSMPKSAFSNKLETKLIKLINSTSPEIRKRMEKYMKDVDC